MDTEDIFKAALAKYPVIDINARNEFQNINDAYPPKNEGERLTRFFGFLILEFANPSFKDGDVMARNDLDNRCSLMMSEIVEYAKPFLESDPTLKFSFEEGIKAKTFGDQLSAFDLILQNARVSHANDEKSREQKYEMLNDSIKYYPATHQVFFKDKIASKPRVNSKERLIWKGLYNSKEIPRRVLFSSLLDERDDSGQIIFTDLGESITSDINKWNKGFKPFGVAALHKDGKSIWLDVQPIKKK